MLDLNVLVNNKAVTITANGDNTYDVVVALGKGFAGEYAEGFWGDCAIVDDTLDLCFAYGDIYGDFEMHFGEGVVELTYKGGVAANGLAYTGELAKLICKRINEVTGGLLNACGSEYGMQGHGAGDKESYLSLDIWTD